MAAPKAVWSRPPWPRLAGAAAMALAALTAAGTAGCGGSGGSGAPPSATGTPVPEGDIAFEGTVSAIDVTPMFVDGDGLLIVRAPSQGVLTVRIPAREFLCPARGLNTIHVLRVGDLVRVVGRTVGPGVVRVCEDEAHVLEKVG